MYFFPPKKSFLSVFHCIGIVLFSYLIVHQVYQTSSTYVRSIHQSFVYETFKYYSTAINRM
ncbi:unnamed protein product, partial [Rotaria socialis]